MATTGISLRRLVDVTLNMNPSASQYASVTSVLIIGSSDVIDTTERYRTYASLTAVGNDFGSTTDEYKAATIFFDQTPTPEALVIGRWAQTATHGRLVCGILTSANQVITNWTTITDGGFNIAVDSGAVTFVSGINLSAVTNMNGVASAIQAQMVVAGVAATCTWNGESFVFASNTTGAASHVSALTAANSGAVDISGQLKGTASTLLRRVTGIAAETALAAVTAIDQMPVSGWMISVVSSAATNADHEAIAAYIEGAANPHLYGITTQDANAMSPSYTTDIGYIIHGLGYLRTTYGYSSTNPYWIVSVFGRMATINYSGSNTTIALMYKTAPGTVAENLTDAQSEALDAKQYNYYAMVNGVSIIMNGFVAATNVYLDDVQGSDALVSRVQVDLFNLFYTTTTKIPQTDPGMHVISTTIASSLDAFVTNGQVAAGTWNYGGFGKLSQGDYLESGYYVYVPPVSSQSSADRAARTVSSIQIAAIYAGATQKCGVAITVQR